jgi:hypothetical protein
MDSGLGPAEMNDPLAHAPRAFTTKDSGAREEYESGMVRDTQDGKARFDLLIPRGVPYEEQFLTRWAQLMSRGAAKYHDRNWEQATGTEEIELAGEDTEDHAAAVCFNLMVAETVSGRQTANSYVPT